MAIMVVSALDAEIAADAPKLTHPAGLNERILEELRELRSEVAVLRTEVGRRQYERI